jgi:selenocysteine-specific translation elongation factor
MAGQDVRMADPDFEFIIEESFRITGRGVGVLGVWRSGQFTSGDSGYVQLDAEVIATVSRIDIEYARVPRGERVALFLHDVTVSQVPPGSVVRSRPAGSKAPA